MGRLDSARARLALSVAYVLLAPFAALVAERIEMPMGTPGVAFAPALAVAYLLSVGPRGGPVVALGFLADGLVMHETGFTFGLVVVAAGQALVTTAGVRLIERRFRHHGPVRTPAVMVDFGVVAALVVPLLVGGVEHVVGPGLGLEVVVGSFLAHALADGIGVLALTAGLRMLVMGERVDLAPATVSAVAAATIATVVAVLVTLRVGGVEALASAQVVMLPVLVIALLVGTAGYAIAVAVTTVAVTVALALAGVGADWAISASDQFAWWVAAFAGMLLATEGDRRRATAVEFRTFFMRSATPTLSVNTADGRILLANEAVAGLLGARVGDLVGRDVEDLELGESGVHDRLRALLDAEAEEFSREFMLRSGPGGPRWVRCVAVRVDLGGPQHDVVQVQFLDLTAERERAESLQRSNAALERLGGRVTHDLKQPLSAVASYASTLLEHAEHMDASLVRTMYERLEAVANRAVLQLDETFAASAVSGSGPVLVDLHEVVAAVVGVVEIDLAEVDGSVDSALSATRMRAEPSTLRQVLLNLVTNSCKYARQDAPLRIRIASRVRGAGVEITVSDNGPGIPDDLLEQVFERGRRLDPGRADGRGHGLADSRDLAEAAGGWLRAEPCPDGASFVLWLPDPTRGGSVSATRALGEHVPEELLEGLRPTPCAR